MSQGDVSELLGQLISINSVNPDLIPGAPGETEIAHFIAGWLEERGLEVQLQPTGRDGRANVIAVARGSGGGRSLMLNAHMDTVGVAGMAAPFEPAVRNGRMYGRGAIDTKGGLAAYMMAAAKAKQRHLRGNVVLTAVIDEEYASLGTEVLVRQWKADAALVAEPTNLRIITAHKGFVWVEIEVQGVAAHGSRPEAGVDAIAHMGKVLTELDNLARQLRGSQGHAILGPGSVHGGMIQGGQEMSSYPESCRVGIERRIIPGESAMTVKAEWQQILDGISAADPAFKASLTLPLERKPFEVSDDAPIVVTLRQQAAKVLGKAPETAGAAIWTDAAFLSDAGIPSVVLGPIGDGYHGVDEWVDLHSVEQCCEIALGTAEAFCA